MRVIETGDESEPDRGLIALNDGEKLRGTILEVDFDEGTVEFRPETGPMRVVPFSSLSSVFLARTFELERIPLAMSPGTVEARPLGSKRKCTIIFKDSTTLETDIFAIVPRKAGLFLFVANYADMILR